MLYTQLLIRLLTNALV